MTQTFDLPPPRPNAPIVTRMMTEPIGSSNPVIWVISHEHPLNSGWRIRRMLIDSTCVEVYAVSPDGKHGTRDILPMSRVLLIEEAMSIDVFIDELEAAESDDDDDDPEPPEDPAVAPNEQAVT